MGITSKLYLGGSAGLSRFWNFGTARNSNLSDFYAQLDQPNDSPDLAFSQRSIQIPTELKQKLFHLLQSGIPATDKIFPWVVEQLSRINCRVEGKNPNGQLSCRPSRTAEENSYSGAKSLLGRSWSGSDCFRSADEGIWRQP